MQQLYQNKWGIFILALIPAGFLYFHTLNFSWTPMDEQWMIVHNQELHKGDSILLKAFTEPVAGRYYRPLLQVSFYIDHQLSGLSAKGFHLANLLWHLCAVACLLQLLLEIKVPRLNALLLSALFGLHPLLVHAVAWVPGRNDIMLTVFSVVSIIFYIRAMNSPSKKFLMLHFLFLLLALLTKETAIVLPVICAAMNFLHREKKNLALILGVWAGIFGLWLLSRHLVLSDASPGLQNLDLADLLKGYLLYTGKTLLPFNLSVMPVTRNNLSWAGVIVLLSLPFLFLKSRLNNSGLAGWGLLLFFLTLALPVLFAGTTSGGGHFEHRAYLPLCGFVVFISQLRLNLASRPCLLLITITAVVFFTLASKRAGVYKNEYIFLNAGLKDAPDFFLFPQKRAELYMKEGKNDSALVMISRALQLRPDLAKMYNTRGYLLYQANDLSRAIEDYTKAIELSDYDDYYYLNRFLAYHRQGDVRSAMKDLYYLQVHGPSLIPGKEAGEVMESWISDLDSKISANKKQADPTLALEISELYAEIGMFNEALEFALQAYALDRSEKNQLHLDALRQLMGDGTH